MTQGVQTNRTGRIEVAAQQRLVAAVSAILIGAFLVLGVGFASPEAIHNAAHDSRHAFAFPCH